MESSSYYMNRALQLAQKAAGRTSPNPLVGAVIVKDDKIIGEGYHQKAGTPHAEIHALKAAAQNAAGADMYVSLEPCCHYGKTPPCTEAIIKAGIKRVFVALLDPNPKVAGKGIKMLCDAGIETYVGILEHEARAVNEVFLKYIATGTPFITLKTAMTLDGKIATSSGDSRWITGEDSRQYVHQLRDTHDAIMVGIGTVLADNPMLNTRLNKSDAKDPIRLIIDQNLQIPLKSNIVETAQKQRTIIFSCEGFNAEKAEQLLSQGVEIISFESNNDMVPLQEVARWLGNNDITSVLVEGGAEINASLLEENLVDRVYWFIAGKIAGGKKASSPVAGQGCNLMNDAVKLKNLSYQQIGTDLLISGYLP